MNQSTRGLDSITRPTKLSLLSLIKKTSSYGNPLSLSRHFTFRSDIADQAWTRFGTRLVNLNELRDSALSNLNAHQQQSVFEFGRRAWAQVGTSVDWSLLRCSVDTWESFGLLFDSG